MKFPRKFELDFLDPAEFKMFSEKNHYAYKKIIIKNNNKISIHLNTFICSTILPIVLLAAKVSDSVCLRNGSGGVDIPQSVDREPT